MLDQEIEWLGLRWWAPAEWEIVRHSTRADRGVVTMVDRRRQRFELIWREVPTRPDLEQLLDNYRSRDLEHNPDFRFETFRSSGWLGHRRWGGRGKALTRGARYAPEAGRLVEMVLPWPGRIESRLEAAMLEGFEAIAPAAEARRWKAFDLEVRMPGAWRLSKVKSLSGDLRLFFDLGPRAEAVLRRIKSAHDWFDGDVERFVRRTFKNQDADPRGRIDLPHRSAEAHKLESRGWLRRRRWRRDLAWYCPSNEEVFHVITRTPRNEEVLPEMLAVRCCASVQPLEEAPPP